MHLSLFQHAIPDQVISLQIMSSHVTSYQRAKGALMESNTRNKNTLESQKHMHATQQGENEAERSTAYMCVKHALLDICTGLGMHTRAGIGFCVCVCVHAEV